MVPDVRLPGLANTSDHMSSSGSMKYRSSVLGTPSSTGPAVKSSQATEYSVSKFGRTTERKSASGNARRWWNTLGGPKPGRSAGAFTAWRRLTSMVTSG